MRKPWRSILRVGRRRKGAGMATQSHALDCRQNRGRRNAAGREVIDQPRQSLNRRVRHQVPSTVMAPLRAEMVAAMQAGRSVAQTAKEYDASAFVPLELWMRDMDRRIKAIESRLGGLMRPMAAMACLLIGVAVADVWEAATDGGVAVERGFRRNGRARKRGLEDGPALIELRRVDVAGGGA